MPINSDIVFGKIFVVARDSAINPKIRTTSQFISISKSSTDART
jgi:hypothetical protein